MQKNNNTKIGIYHNLPSGGAREVCINIIKFLKKEFKVSEFVDAKPQKFTNFITYMYCATFGSYAYAKKISHVLNKYDAAIVFQSWLIKSPYILRFLKIPTFFFCQEIPKEFYDLNFKRNQNFKEIIINILRLPIKYSDKKNILKSKNIIIVANSNKSANEIKNAYGLNAIVIYPGIQKSTPKAKTKTNVEKYILCVGALNKNKNQMHILNAMSLIDSNIRPKLILVGNGGDPEYISRLNSFAKSNSISLEIMLNVSRSQLNTIYANATIFCFTPRNEPFGIVALEAMLHGLPIITVKDSGGFTELLNKKNGIIVQSWEPKQLAHSIEKLINNPARIKQISEYNQIYSKQFSDNKMYEQFKQVLLNNI